MDPLNPIADGHCTVCGRRPRNGRILHWAGCPNDPHRPPPPPPQMAEQWESTRTICAMLTAFHHRQLADVATLIAGMTDIERGGCLSVAVAMLHEALLARCVEVGMDMPEYLRFLGATAAAEPSFERLPCTTRPLNEEHPICDDCGHLGGWHTPAGYCSLCAHPSQKNPLHE